MVVPGCHSGGSQSDFVPILAVLFPSQNGNKRDVGVDPQAPGFHFSGGPRPNRQVCWPDVVLLLHGSGGGSIAQPSDAMLRWQVSIEVPDLRPGVYTIMVCTYHAGNEAPFRLSVYSPRSRAQVEAQLGTSPAGNAANGGPPRGEVVSAVNPAHLRGRRGSNAAATTASAAGDRTSMGKRPFTLTQVYPEVLQTEDLPTEEWA